MIDRHLKKWDLENKEWLQEYYREYNKKNRDKINKQKRINYKKNRDKILLKLRQWRLKNKEIVKGYRKKERQKNGAKMNKRTKLWHQNNTKKVREQRIRRFEETHQSTNYTIDKWRWKLGYWSMLIKEKSKGICFCGNKATDAHHILHKSKYPQLALNPNNGIALCLIHHQEAHGINLAK